MNLYAIIHSLTFDLSTLLVALGVVLAMVLAGPFVRISLGVAMFINVAVLWSGIARVRLNSISPSGDFVGDFHLSNGWVILGYVVILAYVIVPMLLPRIVRERIPFNL